VHIANSNPGLLEVVGEIFRHPFGQGGDQHAFAMALA